MSLKQPATMIAAAAFCAVVGSVSVSAQENCNFMYQRAMEASQARSPHYSRMINHYYARCFSGLSQPAWGGGYRDRHQSYGGDYSRRGW